MKYYTSWNIMWQFMSANHCNFMKFWEILWKQCKEIYIEMRMKFKALLNLLSIKLFSILSFRWISPFLWKLKIIQQTIRLINCTVFIYSNIGSLYKWRNTLMEYNTEELIILCKSFSIIFYFYLKDKSHTQKRNIYVNKILINLF